MSKLILISVLVVSLSLLFAFGTEEYHSPVAANTVQVISFSYSCSGSSTYEIYSYTVETDMATGEASVGYDLCAGLETYTLPADDELMQQLAEIVASHNLSNWDGFEEYDYMIMDGEGFGLDIILADETEISASGRNSFPAGYRDAAEAIDDLFLGYLKKQGIVPLMEQ